MPFLGNKTKEVLEQEMFSLLNMITKRNFYTPEKMTQMRTDLFEACRQYMDLE